MIAFNALAQLTSLGLIILFQTVYLIVAARVLGVEEFGRLSLILAVSQMLLLGGDLGSHLTAVRKISFRRSDSEALFPVFLRLKLLLSGVSLVLLMGLAVFTELGAALGVFAVGMFFHSLKMAFGIGFQAHGRLYLSGMTSVLLVSIQLVLGFSVLWSGGGILGLGGAYAAASLMTLVVSLIVFHKRFHPIRLAGGGSPSGFLREAFPVGLSNLLQIVTSRIDIALLSLLAGSYPAGIYAAALRFPAALNNIPGGVFSAVLPVMAGYGDDRRRVRRLFDRTALLMIGLSLPMAALLFLAADRLVPVLYGAEYEAAVRVLRILAWGVIPAFVGSAFGQVILSQGRLARWLPLISGTVLVLGLGAHLILIPRFGTEGAALATLISQSFGAVGLVLGAFRFLRRGSPGVSQPKKAASPMK